MSLGIWENTISSRLNQCIMCFKNDYGFYHKRIWKDKIPAKIKIFLWLLSCNALVTKDNLQKRNWLGDPSCAFCDCPESISHLFFQWPVACVIWAIIAKCFGANNIPTNIEQLALV